MPKERLPVNVPKLERKYALLYVVDQLGTLTRRQVEDLAAVIDTNTQQGVVESLAEASHAAQLLKAGRHRKFFQDAFLNHVSLSYTTDELHKLPRTEPIAPNEQPRSLADFLAGDGSVRPLLKELYSLEGLGLVIVRTDEDSRELFAPTTRGREYAITLGDTFDRIVNWDHQKNFMAVVTRYETIVQATPVFIR